MTEVEQRYVTSVYERLAVLNGISRRQKVHHKCLNVQKFVDQLEPGSVVLDIGCGGAKYHCKGGLMMASDVCTGILAQVSQSAANNLDLHLADAINLPYRDGSIDAALLISVIHHFSNTQRRYNALASVARCLRKRGRLLIYVWAFEQSSGVFPAQDVLVPCHLHEYNKINGVSSGTIGFHCYSTKEQRLIRESIALDELSEKNVIADTVEHTEPIVMVKQMIQSIFHEFSAFSSKFYSKMLSRISQFVDSNRLHVIVSSKPAKSTISNNAMPESILVCVEQFAGEMSEQILETAIYDTLSLMENHRLHTIYRFYHVFAKGELQSLIEMVPSLRVIEISYQHANWCAIVEKISDGSSSSSS